MRKHRFKRLGTITKQNNQIVNADNCRDRPLIQPPHPTDVKTDEKSHSQTWYLLLTQSTVASSGLHFILVFYFFLQYKNFSTFISKGN